MFTGIIEAMGSVQEATTNGTNRTFWIESSISDQLKPDQSVSHDGVCLTVEAVEKGRHRVTAIDETLKKTNLGGWQRGTRINLEQCLRVGDRLDGHMVQGHVDTTATCIARTEKEGSREYTFQFSPAFAELVIEKGSICVNGISLTAFQTGTDRFTVAIIPYTADHTNISAVFEGDLVNLEFDILGKYIIRKMALKDG